MEMNSLINRYDDGLHIIEEHRRSIIGEHRFSLDRRDGDELTTVGWFKSREEAEKARSDIRCAANKAKG
jgi:hypothetical protein